MKFVPIILTKKQEKWFEKHYKHTKGKGTYSVWTAAKKTNLKIGRQPREKVLLRYYLKKRGYIVDDTERVAYYDAGTTRGKRVEARPQKWYKFLPAAEAAGR